MTTVLVDGIVLRIEGFLRKEKIMTGYDWNSYDYDPDHIMMCADIDEYLDAQAADVDEDKPSQERLTRLWWLKRWVDEQYNDCFTVRMGMQDG